MVMSLTKFWYSNEQMWFNATPADDAEIAQKFSNYDCKDDFERVLWHDQIKRHIARANHEEYDYKHVKIAMMYAGTLLDSDQEFAPKELVFLLLPYRHSGIPSNIVWCLQRIRELMTDNPNPYYRRFHNATVQAVSNCNEPHHTGVFDWDFDDLICETSTFDKDQPPGITDTNVTPPKFRHYDHKVIVSLSGGVDSMTCVIAALDQGLEVTAIFINYNNRPESDAEVKFIAWFCKTVGVELYCRDITEIQRDETYNPGIAYNREFYESHTRKIRFNSYKFVANIVAPDHPELVPIILGHNNDDAEENIFRNIQKSQSIDNLKGMVEYHTENGVLIHRPLLTKSKAWILDYAVKYNIPYLRNSTPDWSERGIMREDVINNIPREILDGLVKHAETVAAMHAFIKSIVYSKAIRQDISDDYTTHSFDIFGTEDSVFWDIMFYRILHTYIKRKALVNFTDLAKRCFDKKILITRTVYAIVTQSVNTTTCTIHGA